MTAPFVYLYNITQRLRLWQGNKSYGVRIPLQAACFEKNHLVGEVKKKTPALLLGFARLEPCF
jgi:hypothetical protein